MCRSVTGPFVPSRSMALRATTILRIPPQSRAAWASFPHEHARSRVYRWGEDAIAGFGDDQLFWCLGLAIRNERDPILKERLFGLTNLEGNHGEDVKELYYYLDGTLIHSWMRM